MPGPASGGPLQARGPAFLFAFLAICLLVPLPSTLRVHSLSPHRRPSRGPALSTDGHLAPQTAVRGGGIHQQETAVLGSGGLGGASSASYSPAISGPPRRLLVPYPKLFVNHVEYWRLSDGRSSTGALNSGPVVNARANMGMWPRPWEPQFPRH